ncbi:malonic semialdehyde reductase [Streptomyces sp. NPDC006879]|uniref:malonic semialdehyde reductase n=1 Tax=Streptomyces sp. NPDC006879 TaxID=3364767 RepID=UPI0036963974
MPSYALDEAALDTLFRQARTANTFTDEPVTAEQLQSVYELVKYAPTAMNSQPLRMLALASGAARSRLVPLMNSGNQKKTESAPLTVVLAADTAFHHHLPTVFPHAAGAREMWEADPAGRAEAARFNALLQIGYFILAVRAAGLAAGPMSGFDAAAVDQEFFPEGTRHTLVVANIGHPGPNAWRERLPRLTAPQVITTL